MKSPRDSLLSMVYATRPLTQKASRRPGIGIREVVTYLLIFSLAAAAIGIFLRWHIGSYYKKEMASWQARQSSLAYDQAQRVADWLKERQEDAKVLSSTLAVRMVLRADAARRHFPGSDSVTSAESLAVLDEVAKSCSYAGVYILDRDAQVVMQSDGSSALSPLFSESCQAVARSGTARAELVGDAPIRSLMGYIAPVFHQPDASAPDRRPDPVMGIVLLVTDASKTLFPLVAREVVPTQTGETILVRRDGDDVVIFSPVRLAPPFTRHLRFPLAAAPLTARLALEGRVTFGAFTDYRGVEVLAATQTIPETGWGLVRKVDRTEALQDFRRAAVAEVLAGIFLIVLLGSLMFFYRRDLMIRALKQDEKKFKTLLESPPDVMIILNRDSHMVFVNSATERLFGYRLEELLGKPVQMLVPERSRDGIAEFYAHFFANPEAQHQMVQQEAMCRRQDGSEFPAEINSSPIETLQGVVVGVAIRDITQRKQAEEALQKSEERYRTLFENAPVGIYRTTPDGRVLAANPALVKMLGYSSFEELAHPNLNTDFFWPEYPRSQFIDRMEQQGGVVGLECAWHRKDGEAILTSGKRPRHP